MGGMGLLLWRSADNSQGLFHRMFQFIGRVPTLFLLFLSKSSYKFWLVSDLTFISIVGRVLMAWSGAMNQVGHHVGNLVSRRLAASAEGRDEEFVRSCLFSISSGGNCWHLPFSYSQLDCTQFVIRASRTPRQRSHGRIVSQLVALLFASCYQLPMVCFFFSFQILKLIDSSCNANTIQALAWAITMLSAHRECVDLLREEIQAAEENGLRLDLSFKSLRLLDSFLRESSRLNPLDGCKYFACIVLNFEWQHDSASRPPPPGINKH